jgi:predicted nucleotide-binding protein (sugar kinase/HSP70/actin superfamily)
VRAAASAGTSSIGHSVQPMACLPSSSAGRGL